MRHALTAHSAAEWARGGSSPRRRCAAPASGVPPLRRAAESVTSVAKPLSLSVMGFRFRGGLWPSAGREPPGCESRLTCSVSRLSPVRSLRKAYARPKAGQLRYRVHPAVMFS